MSAVPGSASGVTGKGKKVVFVSPDGMGRSEIFQLLKQREAPHEGKIRPAPNMVRLKVKTGEREGSVIDFWEAVPDGKFLTPGAGFYKSLMVDCKAVVHVVSNAHADSIDRLVAFLSPSSGIIGQRYLVVNREVPDEMANLTPEQIDHCKSYVRTKEVFYVDAKTGDGLDHVIVTIARNLKSRQKTDTLAE